MAALTLLAGATLIVGLGRMDLWGIREARVLLPAREMLASGDWTAPRLGGRLRLEKPPLPYWQAAALGLLTGQVDLWESRLPVAIQGVLLVLLCYAFGRSLFGPAVGFAAACLLLTTCFFVVEFRQASHDPSLTFYSSLAIVLIWWAWRTTGRLAGWLLPIGAYAAMGLAVLAKGPIVAVTCFLPLGVWVLWTRRWSYIWRVKPLLGVVVLGAIVAPWYLALDQRGLDPFGVTGKQTLIKLDILNPHGFIESLPTFSYPWVALAIGGLVAPVLRRYAADRAKLWFPWVWFMSIFVFLSLFARDKLTYLLPAAVPMCLLAAYCWDALIVHMRSGRLRWEDRLLFRAQIAIPVLFGLGAGVAGVIMVDGHAWAVVLASLFMAASGAVFCVSSRQGLVRTALGTAVLLCASYAVLYGVLVPAENPNRTFRPMVDELERTLAEQEQREGRTLPLYDYLRQRPFLYYFLRRELQRVDTPEELRRLCEQGEPFHMIVWIKAWVNPEAWRRDDEASWPQGVDDPRRLFRVIKMFTAPGDGEDPEVVLLRYEPVGATTRPLDIPEYKTRKGRPLPDLVPPYEP